MINCRGFRYVTVDGLDFRVATVAGVDACRWAKDLFLDDGEIATGEASVLEWTTVVSEANTFVAAGSSWGRRSCWRSLFTGLRIGGVLPSGQLILTMPFVSDPSNPRAKAAFLEVVEHAMASTRKRK